MYIVYCPQNGPKFVQAGFVGLIFVNQFQNLMLHDCESIWEKSDEVAPLNVQNAKPAFPECVAKAFDFLGTVGGLGVEACSWVVACGGALEIATGHDALKLRTCISCISCGRRGTW